MKSSQLFSYSENVPVCFYTFSTKNEIILLLNLESFCFLQQKKNRVCPSLTEDAGGKVSKVTETERKQDETDKKDKDETDKKDEKEDKTGIKDREEKRDETEIKDNDEKKNETDKKDEADRKDKDEGGKKDEKDRRDQKSIPATPQDQAAPQTPATEDQSTNR